MMPECDERAVLARYGALLQYPGDEVHALGVELLDALRQASAGAADALAAFLEEARGMSRHALQEHYTRAFDLAPQAVPYLSVYLFGAESTQRGQFMAGLSLSYAQQGFDTGTELPDHVSLVLRYAPFAPAEEWEELRAWCLSPPVKQMARDLDRAQNPYRHLMQSLAAVLAAPVLGDAAHV
jgi:nitrate reductase delta subunit